MTFVVFQVSSSRTGFIGFLNTKVNELLLFESKSGKQYANKFKLSKRN